MVFFQFLMMLLVFHFTHVFLLPTEMANKNQRENDDFAERDNLKKTNYRHISKRNKYE